MKKFRELHAKIKAEATNQYQSNQNPHLKLTQFDASFEEGFVTVDATAESISGNNEIEGWVIMCFPVSQANNPEFGLAGSGIPTPSSSTCDVAVMSSVTDYLNQEWIAWLLFVVNSELVSYTKEFYVSS